MFLIPANINAESVENIEQEFYKTVENLNSQNLKLEIIPIDEFHKASNTNTLNFETVEEFEKFMLSLDKESINKNSENIERESRIEHFRNGKWVEIDQKEFEQIINYKYTDNSI